MGLFDGNICKRTDCHRGGPHFEGEYACVLSDVWRCPRGVSADGSCRRFGNHRAGCGCPGDPKVAPPFVPFATMPAQEPVALPDGAL